MIEYPDLEIRNEDQLVAEAVSRTSGGLTVEIVEAQIRERQEMLKFVAAGLAAPICPELTNANPSTSHTVLLEAMGWLLAQQGYRFNQIPAQNHIAFANLFKIETRPATAAETFLRFTTDAPSNTDVTIPAGTQVSDESEIYIFETVTATTIPGGTTTADILARRMVARHTLLAPNALVKLRDSIAFVAAVTNTSFIDSGTELESLDATLERVRQYQRRGERIVSVQDLEEAILSEALLGNGIVKAFPYIAGDLSDPEFDGTIPQLGQTTVVAANSDGSRIDDVTRERVNDLIEQVVGNQFIYLADPLFVEFNIEAEILLDAAQTANNVIAAVEKNLRNFYSLAKGNFGRPIFRSEIIAVLEGTDGVNRIVPQAESILIAPVADVQTPIWKLPKLVNITINAIV